MEPVPAKRDTVAELLPPRRSVRRTYDLLEDAVASLWEARGIDPKNAAVGPRLKSLYEKLSAQER